MAAPRFDLGLYSITNADGSIEPGATLTFYESGTTTLLATYSDPGLTIANVNPVVADANGRFGNIFLQNRVYKAVLKKADGTVIKTLDPANTLVDSGSVSFENIGASASERTVQGRLRDWVSVLDYGADNSGVNDCLAAINAAASQPGVTTVFFPRGNYKVTGQVIKPDGVSFVGAGMAATALLVTYAGYAVRIDGIGGAIRDMQIQCSHEGVKFYANPAGSASYTLYNSLYRVDIVGPGRAATFAARTTHGIIFDPFPPNFSAAYFNTVQECRIRQFDIGITFDAVNGGSSSGGNANRCYNNQIEGYWIAYEIRSIENEISGGFLHAASGNSPAEPTIGYWLTNGAHFNLVQPATGEPGVDTQCLLADADTFANYIFQTGANYQLTSVNAGDNNIIGWLGSSAGSLTENTYYRAQITRAFTTYSGGSYRIRWASGNTPLSGASGGEATIFAYRAAGTVQCYIQDYSGWGTGRSVNFVGVYVNPSNELEAVFYVDNNGTGTSAADIVFDVEGVGNGGSVVNVNSFTNAGTVNPSTFGVLRATATWDPGSVSSGAQTSTTVTVTGAAVGDSVRATFSLSLAGLQMTAYVSAANTVTVLLGNLTGGAVDLASGTLTVTVSKI